MVILFELKILRFSNTPQLFNFEEVQLFLNLWCHMMTFECTSTVMTFKSTTC